MLRLILSPCFLLVLWMQGGCSAPSTSPPKLASESSQSLTLRADASAIAYVIQAERYVLQSRYNEAINQYRLALIHDPYSAELHLRLAHVLGKENRWLAALEALKKGLVAQPSHPALHLALGKLHLAMEDYEPAQRVLANIGPSQEAFQQAWVLRFESALWLKDSDLIQKIRDQGLHEFPDMTCTVARLFEDHGDDVQARFYFERCPVGDEALLRIDFRSGGGALPSRWKTVVPEIRLNLQKAQPVSDLSALNRRGVELRRLHRQQPGDCHVLQQLGLWYGQSEDPVRSLRYLGEAYRRCPREPAIVLALAWAQWGQGNLSKAVELSQWVLNEGFDEPYCNEARKVIELSHGPAVNQ